MERQRRASALLEEILSRVIALKSSSEGGASGVN
jgi:hypothetical protein